MAITTVNGVNVYFEAPNFRPNTLPILFIHGAGGTSHKWFGQLPHLSRRFNPIAVDLPGHGNSEGTGYSKIDDYCSFVKSFAEALNLTSFVLAGQSMGGAVALDFAHKNPELLKALILIDTGARLKVAPDFLESLRQGITPPYLLQLAYSSKTPQTIISNGEMDFHKTSNTIRHGDFVACDNFNLIDELKNIYVPTLIICGQDDQLTPVKYSEVLHSNLPHASLEIIPDAGHMSMIEQPEAVNISIETFLHTLSGCNLAF